MKILINYQNYPSFTPIFFLMSSILSSRIPKCYCNLTFSFFMIAINSTSWLFFSFCSLICFLLYQCLLTLCNRSVRAFLLKYLGWRWFYRLGLSTRFLIEFLQTFVLFMFRFRPKFPSAFELDAKWGNPYF